MVTTNESLTTKSKSVLLRKSKFTLQLHKWTFVILFVFIPSLVVKSFWWHGGRRGLYRLSQGNCYHLWLAADDDRVFIARSITRCTMKKIYAWKMLLLTALNTLIRDKFKVLLLSRLINTFVICQLWPFSVALLWITYDYVLFPSGLP